MKFPEFLRVYGDVSYRGDCPSETVEQVTFFAWIRSEYPTTWGVLATHIRNEGQRTWRQAAYHKAEGMTKGAADILIPSRIPFVCEVKRRDHTKSKWQDGQLEYLEAAHDAGSFVCVVLGYEAAKVAVEDWLSLK